MEKDERHTHPSFGQIHFSRVNGRSSFYGSELEQDHFITMEVKQSEIQRGLSHDWYFAHSSPIIAIRMTSNQFAEMLTSLNHGSGVPCTIEIVNQKPVEKYPAPESRKDFVHRKFEERMKEFGNQIRENQKKATDIVKKKTLSKQDIHDLTNQLEWLTGEVERNIPFFAKCFQEVTDEIVVEAKAEVENAIQHKITTLGLNELHKQNKLLENGNSEDEK